MEKEGRRFDDEDDPQFAIVVRRLQTAYPCEKRRMHPQCSRECEPRSEPSLVHQGLLTGPPISCNIYLCKYGSLHFCSAQRCEYYGGQPDQTCHVSGIQHGTVVSSYDAGDSRTWRAPPLGAAPQGAAHAGSNIAANSTRPLTKPAAAKKRKIAAPKPLASKEAKGTREAKGASGDISESAREIVITLLFSTMRAQRNAAAVAQYRRKAQEARQAYANEQKTLYKQLPYLAELHCRTSAILQTPLPLREYERDDSLIQYYVAVIQQLWNKLRAYCDFGNRMDPETVILGVLYMMRQPYVTSGAAGRVLLAPDKFLIANLPPISDMVFFGYDRAKITTGMHMLQTLYTSDLAPELLMLDVAQLPEKGASTGLIKL